MEAPDIQFLLCLSYAIPTWILYAFIFHTIFISSAKSKFSGSFYAIFGISTVYYILYSIFYYINMRVVNTYILIPFVNSWGIRGFFVTFFHLMPWYLVFGLHLFNCLLAFNRLTVFIFKAKYQLFWGYWLKYFLAFPILFPLLLVWHIPFTDIYMEIEYPDNPDGTRYSTEGDKEAVPWMDNPRNSAILICITSTLSLGMNLFVIAKLMQQKYCMSESNQVQGKISPQDLKMTIYTLLIFVTDVIYFIFLCFLITATDFEFIIWMLNIQQYLVDIQTLAPAWFVVMTNRNLRKQIGMSLKSGGKSELSITVTATSSSRITPFSIRGTKISSHK